MLNIHPSILLFLQKTPELHSQQTFKPVPIKLSCAFNFPKIRNLLPNSRYKSQEAFESFYFLVFLTERVFFLPRCRCTVNDDIIQLVINFSAVDIFISVAIINSALVQILNLGMVVIFKTNLMCLASLTSNFKNISS